MTKREFRLEDEIHYNRSGPVRWIISHLARYPHARVMLSPRLALDLDTEVDLMRALRHPDGRWLSKVVKPGIDTAA